VAATRIRRWVNAPRASVYRALLDARAVATWMVPPGMTSRVHAFDPREGGTFRISLAYDAPTGTGKTTAHTDTYHGRFVRLVEDDQVVEVVEFETTDPALQGEMTITISLADADGGTEVFAMHEGLPPGLSAADNETGWRESLAKLAAFVEAPGGEGQAPHERFVAALAALADPPSVAEVSRFFRADPNGHSGDNEFLGVRPGKVFPVAKRFAAMALADIERLLLSPYYEVRLGAVAIMDFQARARRTSAEHREALYALYLRRHDRINNWDLVDRAAPYVVGGHLADRPRGVLDDLARSANPWERRTAIVSTCYFIRAGDVEDTFRIAELLVHDGHDLVQKAVGSWVREAGKKDQPRLLRFLDAHAAAMPRTMLRYAVERLAPEVRGTYLSPGAT
jgi:3-methyladenine DNA glycosylase AlkD/uncharacterized protein YndB with AHSA1/START domain